MSDDAEVIVVGAGPAGATTARRLALRGIDTLLLERAPIPRYKSCAGGITGRTVRALDFPIDEVVEDTATGMTLTHLGRHGFTRWARAPLVYLVMRDRFDALLAARAQEAGARLIARAAVREVRRDGEGFRVQTGSTTLTCRYLVGADGANSGVARALGLGTGLAESVALEAEVEAGTAALARWRGLINLDLGYRPWGYAWVFPKRDLLSIGVVLPARAGRNLRRELAGYLSRLDLSGARIVRLVGHKIVFRRDGTPIAGDGAALVGDAAGLAEEFGHEGIYYAVRSGALVAEHIARSAAAGERTLAGYERAVDRELMPDLHAARVIARLFYGAMRRAPAPAFILSRRSVHPWRALFPILRGESSYAAELRRTPLLPALAPLLLKGGGA